MCILLQHFYTFSDRISRAELKNAWPLRGNTREMPNLLAWVSTMLISTIILYLYKVIVILAVNPEYYLVEEPFGIVYILLCVAVD